MKGMKKIYESMVGRFGRKRTVSGGFVQMLDQDGGASLMSDEGPDKQSGKKSGKDSGKASGNEPVRGPWGGNGGGNGDSSGDNGGGDSPKPGPRNPWTQPPPSDRPVREVGARPTAIDELWRMGRDGLGMRGGGNGGGRGGRGGPALGNGKSLLPLIIIVIIGLWLVFTSFHRIDSSEEGVVTRFGKFSHNIGPGMNLTFPAPIDKVKKVNVELVRTIEIGSASPDDKNLVLTGDQNIIDLAYAVRWKIKNPQQYEFQLADPEDTIKEVAESAMRATVANFKLTDAIGPARGEIEAEVRERMQDLLDSYKAGISVEGVALNQTAPPDEVKDAFNEVSAAQQKSEGYLNDARAYAQQVTQGATGEAAQFDKVYEQYRLAPEVTRRRMYYETMETVLGQVDKAVVETSGVQAYLPLPEIKKRAQAAPAPADAPATVREGQ